MPAPICRFAQERSERAFDVSYVSLKEFDEASGSLIPSAVSAAAPGESHAIGPVSPGENPIWRAYGTGDSSIIGVDQLPISEYAGNEIAQALVVPIGDFGVTVAFSAEADGFDQVDLELGKGG